MSIKTFFCRFHITHPIENSFGLLKRIQRPNKYSFQHRRYSTYVAKRKTLEKHKNWESVVGLEVHAQISASSKLFSGSGTDFTAPINYQVSFFDAALPGTLPVLNKRCVEAAVLTALALNCHINKTSVFDRKHYFYADLPSGYQITQQRLPIAKYGKFPFAVLNVKEPYIHESRIIQLQLEQDSGRSIHDDVAGISLIDLNRAGLALMEIVFDADLSNGEEAAALVEELKYLLQYIGTCDGRMEVGSLRVDANISVNKPGEPWGTRTEVKNIGSIKSVAKAIDYEIERQISVLENGGKIDNETRMFDAALQVTVPMRDKETQQDYRFMPEPNLPPLRLQDEDENIPGAIKITEIAKNLPPQLPYALRLYLSEKYKLTLKTADHLVKHNFLLNCFKVIISNEENNPTKVMNFFQNELYTMFNKYNLSVEECPVPAEKLKQVFELRIQKKITKANTDELLDMLFSGDGRNVSEIVASKNWNIIRDEEVIEKIVKKVVDENPKLVELYKKGKKKGKPKIENPLMKIVYNTSQPDQIDMKLAKGILLKMLNDE